MVRNPPEYQEGAGNLRITGKYYVKIRGRNTCVGNVPHGGGLDSDVVWIRDVRPVSSNG